MFTRASKTIPALRTKTTASTDPSTPKSPPVSQAGPLARPLSAAELRQNLIKMYWLAQAAREGLGRLIAMKPQAAGIVLTVREIEVSRWTADGKTSGEVGDILTISERTVNFHVANFLAKLGSVNKTAGVLKAAMLRLL